MRSKHRGPYLLALFLLLPLVFAPLLVGCDEGSLLSTPTPPKSITIIYDPNKTGMFEDLVSTYNRQAKIKVDAVKTEIAAMSEALLDEDVVGLSPDSSLWMASFEKYWEEQFGAGTSPMGTTVRYATTPVVLATWRGQEGDLGGRDRAGWESLLQKASSDSNYKWSHGSPRASASGMLALVAEFYAGAKKTFGLTKEDADRTDVRDYVGKLQRTIARYGGESDAALVDYLLKQGQSALSAIVLPEASVFDFNQRTKSTKLAALQPIEGTLMLDHPLILVERASLTPDQRRAFLEFSRFLTSGEGQSIVAKHGFRPVDLNFDMSKSPLASEGISTDAPKLLQMPTPGTVDYLLASWASGLKRRANIILTVDVSGSMEGEKLRRTKEALQSFLKQIPSSEERVGLVTFSSDFVEVVPLARLGDNRQQLVTAIDGLKAGGNTAWFYALWRSYRLLAILGDAERINVVVGMTDGKENASSNFSRKQVEGIGLVPQLTGSSAAQTEPAISAMKALAKNVMVFTVGYGSDADMVSLDSLASGLGGRSYTADPDTIKKLYELISQNF